MKSLKLCIYNGPQAKKLINSFSSLSSVLSNVSEKELCDMKYKDKIETKSYYVYSQQDVVGKTLHDVDCPNLSLYDDFIKVHKD